VIVRVCRRQFGVDHTELRRHRSIQGVPALSLSATRVTRGIGIADVGREASGRLAQHRVGPSKAIRVCPKAISCTVPTAAPPPRRPSVRRNLSLSWRNADATIPMSNLEKAARSRYWRRLKMGNGAPRYPKCERSRARPTGRSWLPLFRTYGRTPRLVFRVHALDAVFRLPRASAVTICEARPLFKSYGAPFARIMLMMSFLPAVSAL
jgi:hypothetical protein